MEELRLLKSNKGLLYTPDLARNFFKLICYIFLRESDKYCLVPRRLSVDENVRAKEGGKETTGETCFACRLYPSHGPLWFITSHSFRARLCHAVTNTFFHHLFLIIQHAPQP